MKVPLEITFHGIDKSAAIEDLVRAQAVKLETFCAYVSSCRVVIEKPQPHHRSGPFRIRIDLTVPPGHELVVVREPKDTNVPIELRTAVIDAFKAARRQLQKLTALQRSDVKTHAEPHALVVRLFADQGWGFLKTPEGEEVYFHRNSVLHGDFDRLAIGTEVRFAREEGDNGPQATSVQIVNKPGARAGSGEQPIKPPLGWSN